MLLVNISVGNIIRRHSLKTGPFVKKYKCFTYCLALNFTNLVILSTQCTESELFPNNFHKMSLCKSHFHRANFLQGVVLTIESLS